MARRYTTRREDAAFMMNVLAGATKGWKVGDACRAYRGTDTTTVIRIEGDAVYLANGDSMHRSKMRLPER